METFTVQRIALPTTTEIKHEKPEYTTAEEQVINDRWEK